MFLKSQLSSTHVEPITYRYHYVGNTQFKSLLNNFVLQLGRARTTTDADKLFSAPAAAFVLPTSTSNSSSNSSGISTSRGGESVDMQDDNNADIELVASDQLLKQEIVRTRLQRLLEECSKNRAFALSELAKRIRGVPRIVGSAHADEFEVDKRQMSVLQQQLHQQVLHFRVLLFVLFVVDFTKVRSLSTH